MLFKTSLAALVLALSAGCAHAPEIEPQPQKLEAKISAPEAAAKTPPSCSRGNQAHIASYEGIAIPDSFLKYLQKNDVFEGKVWDTGFAKIDFEGRELNVLYLESQHSGSLELWADDLAILIGKGHYGTYSLVNICIDGRYSNALREKVEFKDFEGSLKIEAEAREFLERLFEEFKYAEVK